MSAKPEEFVTTVSRRRFLIGGSSAIGGLIIGVPAFSAAADETADCERRGRQH
jgi:hypothetical protein